MAAGPLFFTNANTLQIMAFLKPDGSALDYDSDGFLSSGLYGIILRQGDTVLKIPKKFDLSKSPEDQRQEHEFLNEVNHAVFEREKKVYYRVGSCEGLVDKIDILDDGIQLQYLPDGDLEAFIQNQEEAPTELKLNWIFSIVSTLCYLHSAKILVYDIAIRNFLIATDRSLRMIDFGQSTVFPEDTDMSKANDDGCTVQTDVFLLGCVIYSIATWSRFEYNLLAQGFVRPSLQELPDTGDTFCADIIQGCWDGRFQEMEQLRSECANLLLEQNMTQ